MNCARLKTNIGESKKTSREEVERGAQDKQIEDSFNVESNWVINKNINISK